MNQTKLFCLLSTLCLATSVQANLIKKAKSKLGLTKSCTINQQNIRICQRDLVLIDQKIRARVKKIYSTTDKLDQGQATLVVREISGKIRRVDINQVSKMIPKKCHTLASPNHPLVKEKTFCRYKKVFSNIPQTPKLGTIQKLYHVLHDLNQSPASTDILAIISWGPGEKEMLNLNQFEASVLQSPTSNIQQSQIVLYTQDESPEGNVSMGKVKHLFTNGKVVIKPFMKSLENQLIMDSADIHGSLYCINGVKEKDQVMLENSAEFKVLHAFSNGTILVRSKTKYKDFKFINTNQQSVINATPSEHSCENAVEPWKLKTFLHQIKNKAIDTFYQFDLSNKINREPLDDEMN